MLNRKQDNFGELCQLNLSFFNLSLSRLRDGRSIRTVSALLLQLVQTSAHDVRIGAKKIAKLRQQNVIRYDNRKGADEQPTVLDERDLEVCWEACCTIITKVKCI
jgi:cohesin loading factor subunit SCC2